MQPIIFLPWLLMFCDFKTIVTEHYKHFHIILVLDKNWQKKIFFNLLVVLKRSSQVRCYLILKKKFERVTYKHKEINPSAQKCRHKKGCFQAISLCENGISVSYIQIMWYYY